MARTERNFRLRQDVFYKLWNAKADKYKTQKSIQDAAEICGVHFVTLYSYLRNEKVARFKTAVLIADGLKVPIETIFQVQDY